MSNFYIKKKDGSYVPIELKSIINKDLDNHLIIIRVGTDDHPASITDLDKTEESFIEADIINDLNVSVVITPYQIDIDVVTKEEIEDKELCLQISSGDDIGMLEDKLRKMYKQMKSKYEVTVLPTPLKLRDYRKVKDILQRSQIRKDRRGRSRG